MPMYKTMLAMATAMVIFGAGQAWAPPSGRDSSRDVANQNSGSGGLNCCGGQEWGGGLPAPRGYTGGFGGGLSPSEQGGNQQNGTGRGGAGPDGGW